MGKRSKLKAPFPYFGGKSSVAKLVWERLGDVDNFIEPFCGSAAVLLARPSAPRIETVNDQDCYVSNFWRATSKEPEAVAEHADWPVNEADLHARHRCLVLSEEAQAFRQRIRTEPDYYDARVAGWWCWGLCCWIGGGWCTEPGVKRDGRMPMYNQDGQGLGVNRPPKGHTADQQRRPVIANEGTDGGRGVHAKVELRQKRPRAHGDYDTLPGVHGRPQLADSRSRGRGVHNDNHLADGRSPRIGGNGSGAIMEGVHRTTGGGTCEQRRAWLVEWFGRLRDRLRTVRVCCGHWLRVCDSESVTTRLGTTGIFLDPPYPTHEADGSESRAGGLYGTDGSKDELDQLRDEVLAYCLERGKDKRMRIAVCGYDTDGYAVLEKQGWDCVSWKAQGGYGNRSANGKSNAVRERIWFSPGCEPEPTLFSGLEEVA